MSADTQRTSDPVSLLKKRQGSRSQRELAREIGISAAYLTHLYKSRREPGPKVLDYLGLQKVVSYQVTYQRKRK